MAGGQGPAGVTVARILMRDSGYRALPTSWSLLLKLVLLFEPDSLVCGNVCVTETMCLETHRPQAT